MALVEKEQMVTELNQNFSSAVASFVVEYAGISTSEVTAVRRKLNAKGARLKVIKNTLARRAVTDTDLAKLAEHFSGPTVVVFADSDPVESAKILLDFAKKNETVKLKGGYVDGTIIEGKEIEALAKMPSKLELQAKLLALIAAPATQLVRLLNAPGTNFVRLLDQYRQKLEQKGQS
ncbi:50S ribosomal protein L10 [bacterium]|nr:50S ribosomal protein L10 [bacterium]